MLLSIKKKSIHLCMYLIVFHRKDILTKMFINADILTVY